MREKFNISDEVEVRLWQKYKSHNNELLNKREQMLQEAGLHSGQKVIIETRNKDGSWPRGGTGKGFKVSAEQRQKLNQEKESEKQKDLQRFKVSAEQRQKLNQEKESEKQKNLQRFKVSTEQRQKLNQEKESEKQKDLQRTRVGAAQELVRCHHDGCESPAHLYCTTCQENLCPGCAGLHLMKKSKRGHNVVEYQSRGSCRAHVYCATHDHMVCELYCEHCENPVCPNCLIDKSHKGHDYRKIATVLDAKKSCIQKEKDGIENHIQRLHEKMEVVDTKMKEREEKYRNLLKEVENREKELLEAVKTVAAQRKQTINDMKASDKSQIQAERNKLDLQISKAKMELESCEKLLQNQNPDQMLSFESGIFEFQVVPEINLDWKTSCFTRGSLSADDMGAGFGDIQ